MTDELRKPIEFEAPCRLLAGRAAGGGGSADRGALLRLRGVRTAARRPRGAGFGVRAAVRNGALATVVTTAFLES